MGADFLGRRLSYEAGRLTEEDCGSDPMAFLRLWIDEASEAGLIEPTACALATAGKDGRPSNRIVLLRKLDDGLVFFSNYESRKGQELATNPLAAMTFFWPQLQRQARIEGTVAKVSAAESDEYFAGRPYGSQLAAAASPQSQKIRDRAALTARAEELAAVYPDQVPRPSHWGGFRLTPEAIEFWQGRPGRLHDRILFERGPEGWARARLAP
ncbi:MAG: pyridoxamine 5'-phosphate oxidase [Fimbriimonadaceae bacterium]|nr:pyridoxamine 5'-phosphate oxidase [Fimbriimonadaceae bacterium]QYK57203.1 MAG: pyridoxamine 5'-phosphate oxidase [Fimbriimonadaceae bacterium]